MAAFTSFQNRDGVRLVLVREVSLPESTRSMPAQPASETLQFDRLARYVAAAGDALPQCLHMRPLVDGLPELPEAITAHESFWLLRRSGVTLEMITVDLPDQSRSLVIDSLEAMYRGVDASEGRPAEFTFHDEDGPPHKHQLAFFPSAHGHMTFDEIQRYVYRADLAAVEKHSSIVYPGELNRRGGRGAGCGPFVSVTWGQQDYIENCAVLSAMLAVGASVTTRDVQERILELMHELETSQPEDSSDIRAARQQLNDHERQFAHLQNQMVFGLDAVSTLMPLVPSLRPESFHLGLFTAIGTEDNRIRLERIADRFREVLTARADSLHRASSSARESRVRRWSVTVALISVLAVPFSVLFGYFGMSTREVSQDRSFLDVQHYWVIYAMIMALTVAIWVVHLALLLRDRRHSIASERT